MRRGEKAKSADRCSGCRLADGATIESVSMFRLVDSYCLMLPVLGGMDTYKGAKVYRRGKTSFRRTTVNKSS